MSSRGITNGPHGYHGIYMYRLLQKTALRSNLDEQFYRTIVRYDGFGKLLKFLLGF